MFHFLLSENEVLLTDDFIGLTSVEEFDNSFFTIDEFRTQTETSQIPANRNM